MGQWGNVDNAANSVNYVPVLTKRKANTGNQTLAFGNTTANVWGSFALTPDEVTAKDGIQTHAGWVVRRVGSGGRAGRTQYECLVAMSSVTGDFEDTVTPDNLITLTTSPANQSIATGSPTTFVVAATITPAGSLTYQWQLSTGGAYSNLTDVGVYTNVTTATLNISNVAGLTGNRYRCIVSGTTADPKTTAGAILTVV